MSWSEPLLRGYRVLDDIDTWVVQIAEKPEVTEERKPPDHTYTFVKLDRGTEDDDLRKQVIKRECPDYIRLWKKAKQAWDAIERGLYNSDGTDIDGLLEEVTEYCEEFLALRREIRELDMSLRSHKDLYKSSVLCLRNFMDYRSNLLYIQRTDDVDAKDAVWELYKGVSGYNPVQDPSDVEVVIVTIGAVCPRAYERKNKGALQKLVDECGWPDGNKPEKGSPEWLDVVLGQMISYGAYANLEEKCFLHEDDAIPWARHQLGVMGVMLGFALDRVCNAIGSSGWDFLCGDVLAGLRRPPPKGKELEHGLMRKISGLAELPKAPESES